MAYLIQPKKVRLSGNELLVRPLTRREANAFRERMAAADDDADAAERAGLDAIAAHVTFADGAPLDVDDVPTGDLVALLRTLVGGEAPGVSDFTPAP